MKQEKAVKSLQKKMAKIKEKEKRKSKQKKPKALKTKRQEQKASDPYNQKARVIKRIQGFEHQWIGGPTGIKSWPKRLNQAVPNHVLVA